MLENVRSVVYPGLSRIKHLISGLIKGEIFSREIEIVSPDGNWKYVYLHRQDILGSKKMIQFFEFNNICDVNILKIWRVG